MAIEQILAVLRADNWIHAHEPPDSALWRCTKADMYDAFVRPELEWKTAIIDQGRALVERLIGALHDTQAADFRR